MNWIDLLLCMIVLLSVGASIQRGFIISTWELISWLGSLTAAFLSFGPLSEICLRIVPTLGFWATPVVFIFVVLISRIILDQLGAYLIAMLPAGLQDDLLNKILGLIPGLIHGLIWATAISALLLYVPISSYVSSETQSSALTPPLLDKAAWLQNKLHPVFSEVFHNGIAKTNPVIKKDESIKLPYTVKNPKVSRSLATDMLHLINDERAKEGKKPLSADPALAEVALAHSRDMFARGYFSHINPEGKTPFNRIDEAKIRYLSAGENLALAQTLYIAHTGLMNSPGHRANIMNSGFGRVGIGVLDGGIYGLMITQVFRN